LQSYQAAPVQRGTCLLVLKPLHGIEGMAVCFHIPSDSYEITDFRVDTPLPIRLCLVFGT
jgi:hypothetical protein